MARIATPKHARQQLVCRVGNANTDSFAEHFESKETEVQEIAGTGAAQTSCVALCDQYILCLQNK